MGSVTQIVCARLGQLRNTDSRPFVDTSGIARLFDNGQVALIMQEHNADPHHILTYSSIVQKKAPMIFAALVWLLQPLYIVTFLEAGIDDKKLPLDAQTLQRVLNESHLSVKFYETQYEYVPHYFERGLHISIHDKNVVLPFFSVERIPEIDGSFGCISRVTICPTFHNLSEESVRSRLAWWCM
jgi:hypothetical protein